MQGNDTVRGALVDKNHNEQTGSEQDAGCMNYLKLGLLITFTYVLILTIYAISTGFELMVQKNTASSFRAGGGILFGLFIVYVGIIALFWYKGNKKRDQIRKDAVDKQIAFDKAQQGLRNLE